MASTDDWTREWQPVIEAIGQDFSEGKSITGVEDVEKASIRRFLEAIENDCPIHYDESAAKKQGYRGIVAPISSITQTFVDQGQWRPGMPTNFPTADKHGGPLADLSAALSGPDSALSFGKLPVPKFAAGFATDVEVEYFEPVVVGDRITQRGQKLMSCIPKETRVGRGAFLIFENEFVNQNGELVARMRRGVFLYNPTPEN